MLGIEILRAQSNGSHVCCGLLSDPALTKTSIVLGPTESIRTTRVAAHRLNLRVTHGRLDVRRNFFSVRVTGLWNDIPGHIKDQKTATGFKNAYAKFRKTIAQRG